jgi:hypothetical protein
VPRQAPNIPFTIVKDIIYRGTSPYFREYKILICLWLSLKKLSFFATPEPFCHTIYMRALRKDILSARCRQQAPLTDEVVKWIANI